MKKWYGWGRFIGIFLLMFALPLFFVSCGGSSESTAGKKGEDKAPAGKKWTEADFIEFAKLQVPGFKNVQGSKGTKGSAIIYLQGESVNASNRYPFVMVSMANCFGCNMQKMNKASWMSRIDNLKTMLPTIHKENPELVFDIDEIVIDGTTAIAVYQLSFIKQEKSTAAAHGLNLYYNDGVNMVTLMISSRAKPFKMANSLEELSSQFTKAEFVAAAKAVFKAVKTKF